MKVTSDIEDSPSLDFSEQPSFDVSKISNTNSNTTTGATLANKIGKAIIDEEPFGALIEELNQIPALTVKYKTTNKIIKYFENTNSDETKDYRVEVTRAVQEFG